MPKPLLKKFVREETDPLKLTPRDVAILRDVGECRFLNSDQILALHEGGRRNLKQRLSLLYHHGFLNRPAVQKTAKLASSHIVYSLDRKGVDVLATGAEDRERILRRVQEARRTSSLVSHALMISQFRVCLTLALKSRPDTKLARWVQGDDLKTLLRHRGQNPELVPDAFFTLKDKGDLLHFFLEADRDTETRERFVSKLRIYWDWWSVKRCEESLGVTRFRVLTITPNDARRDTLCLAAKEADPRKQGSAMYLFASETDYSIASPDGLLRTIWSCPKDDAKREILE